MMVDEMEESVAAVEAGKAGARANRLKVKNVEMRVQRINAITANAKRQRARNMFTKRVLEAIAASTKGYGARLAASLLAAYDDVDAGGRKADAAPAAGVEKSQDDG